MTCTKVSTDASAFQFDPVNFKKTNYACDRNPNNPYRYIDGRGVTYWGGYPYCGLNSGRTYIIPPQDHIDIQFTCTVPRCHAKQDVCNLLFNANANNPNGEQVRLDYYTNDPNLTTPGSCFLSGTGNGGWQCIDLANTGRYNDDERNIFSIYNRSQTHSVTISNFQIQRVYVMGSTECDASGYCNDTNTCNDPTQPRYIVKSGSNTDNSGDFFGRLDYPCNLQEHEIGGIYFCGSRSYSFYQNPELHNQTIPKNGGCFQWNIDWTSFSQYNYVGPETCLFNFNQIAIVPNQNPTTTDLELQLWVNGTHCTDYHISSIPEGGFAPSFNLVNCPAYDDDGYNEVVLVNNSDYDVIMLDPAINVYRTYRTESICGTPPTTTYTIYASSSKVVLLILTIM